MTTKLHCSICKESPPHELGLCPRTQAIFETKDALMEARAVLREILECPLDQTYSTDKIEKILRWPNP